MQEFRPATRLQNAAGLAVLVRAVALAAAFSLAGCVSVGDSDPPPVATVAPAISGIPKEAPKVIAPPTAAQRDQDRMLAGNGGAYRSASLDRYLDDLVQRLAAQSDRPDIPYKLTILNSPAVNAFALPSGSIFVTRGLLALANDDSEIAAVIAHEMAHVSEGHAVARQNLERQSALVHTVMTQVVHDPAAGEASQLHSADILASFSRQQELDADQIGVRTIAKAGFDPYGAARFLTSMNRKLDKDAAGMAGEAGAKTYDFLATHPSTPERIQRAIAEAQKFGPPGTGEHDRVGYLEALDGLPYGEDPMQGFLNGQSFVHPRLGFTFNAPQGFTLENTPQAILGVDGSGHALRVDTVKIQPNTSLSAYLTSGWIDGVDTGSVSTLTINGNDAATALAHGQDWNFRLYALHFGGDVYRLIFAARTLSPETDAMFRNTAMSFRRLTPDEIRNIHPVRIDITTAKQGDTLQTLAAHMAAPDSQLDRFLVLNGLDANATIEPGERVKIITQ